MFFRHFPLCRMGPPPARQKKNKTIFYCSEMLLKNFFNYTNYERRKNPGPFFESIKAINSFIRESQNKCAHEPVTKCGARSCGRDGRAGDKAGEGETRSTKAKWKTRDSNESVSNWMMAQIRFGFGGGCAAIEGRKNGHRAAKSTNLLASLENQVLIRAIHPARTFACTSWPYLNGPYLALVQSFFSPLPLAAHLYRHLIVYNFIDAQDDVSSAHPHQHHLDLTQDYPNNTEMTKWRRLAYLGRVCLFRWVAGGGRGTKRTESERFISI